MGLGSQRTGGSAGSGLSNTQVNQLAQAFVGAAIGGTGPSRTITFTRNGAHDEVTLAIPDTTGSGGTADGVVAAAAYSAADENLVLTLSNGDTITASLAALVQTAGSVAALLNGAGLIEEDALSVDLQNHLRAATGAHHLVTRPVTFPRGVGNVVTVNAGDDSFLALDFNGVSAEAILVRVQVTERVGNSNSLSLRSLPAIYLPQNSSASIRAVWIDDSGDTQTERGSIQWDTPNTRLRLTLGSVGANNHAPSYEISRIDALVEAATAGDAISNLSDVSVVDSGNDRVVIYDSSGDNGARIRFSDIPITLSQLPSGVMLDSELTASGVRTLLNIPDGINFNDLVTSASVSGTGSSRQITLTQVDGSTIILSVPDTAMSGGGDTDITGLLSNPTLVGTDLSFDVEGQDDRVTISLAALAGGSAADEGAIFVPDNNVLSPGTNHIAISSTRITTPSDGDTFFFFAEFANTGPLVLQLNSNADRPVVRSDGSALAAGEVTVGRLLTVTWDETNNRWASRINPPASGTGTDGADGIGLEYRYVRLPLSVALDGADRPSATLNYLTQEAFVTDGNAYVWGITFPSLTEAQPVVWRVQRPVPGAPTSGADVGSIQWSNPAVVARLGADGDDGASGAVAGLPAAAITQTGTLITVRAEGNFEPVQIQAGQSYIFTSKESNTGPVDIAFDYLVGDTDTRNLLDAAGNELAAGAINENDILVIGYNGTDWRLIRGIDPAAWAQSGNNDLLPTAKIGSSTSRLYYTRLDSGTPQPPDPSDTPTFSGTPPVIANTTLQSRLIPGIARHTWYRDVGNTVGDGPLWAVHLTTIDGDGDPAAFAGTPALYATDDIIVRNPRGEPTADDEGRIIIDGKYAYIIVTEQLAGTPATATWAVVAIGAEILPGPPQRLFRGVHYDAVVAPTAGASVGDFIWVSSTHDWRQLAETVIGGQTIRHWRPLASPPVPTIGAVRDEAEATRRATANNQYAEWGGQLYSNSTYTAAVNAATIRAWQALNSEIRATDIIRSLEGEINQEVWDRITTGRFIRGSNILSDAVGYTALGRRVRASFPPYPPGTDDTVDDDSDPATPAVPVSVGNPSGATDANIGNAVYLRDRFNYGLVRVPFGGPNLLGQFSITWTGSGNFAATGVTGWTDADALEFRVGPVTDLTRQHHRISVSELSALSAAVAGSSASSNRIAVAGVFAIREDNLFIGRTSDNEILVAVDRTDNHLQPIIFWTSRNEDIQEGGVRADLFQSFDSVAQDRAQVNIGGPFAGRDSGQTLAAIPDQVWASRNYVPLLITGSTFGRNFENEVPDGDVLARIPSNSGNTTFHPLPVRAPAGHYEFGFSNREGFLFRQPAWPERLLICFTITPRVWPASGQRMIVMDSTNWQMWIRNDGRLYFQFTPGGLEISVLPSATIPPRDMPTRVAIYIEHTHNDSQGQRRYTVAGATNRDLSDPDVTTGQDPANDPEAIFAIGADYQGAGNASFYGDISDIVIAEPLADVSVTGGLGLRQIANTADPLYNFLVRGDRHERNDGIPHGSPYNQSVGSLAAGATTTSPFIIPASIFAGRNIDFAEIEVSEVDPPAAISDIELIRRDGSNQYLEGQVNDEGLRVFDDSDFTDAAAGRQLELLFRNNGSTAITSFRLDGQGFVADGEGLPVDVLPWSSYSISEGSFFWFPGGRHYHISDISKAALGAAGPQGQPIPIANPDREMVVHDEAAVAGTDSRNGDIRWWGWSGDDFEWNRHLGGGQDRPADFRGAISALRFVRRSNAQSGTVGGVYGAWHVNARTLNYVRFWPKPGVRF